MSTIEDLAPLRDAAGDVVTLATPLAVAALGELDLGDLAGSKRGFKATVGEVIDGYGFALGSVAADWYGSARQSSPATGAYAPRPFAGLTDAQLAALVGWSLAPLYSDTPNVTLAASRLSGEVQRTVTNAARSTIVGNTRRDPSSPGWYRAANADCCAFCAVLAQRGPVYREGTAGFQAHGYCRCSPAPLWPGERYETPEYYADFALQYEAAANAARKAGEPVVFPSGRNRRDTVLWRIRESTGRR